MSKKKEIEIFPREEIEIPMNDGQKARSGRACDCIGRRMWR